MLAVRKNSSAVLNLKNSCAALFTTTVKMRIENGIYTVFKLKLSGECHIKRFANKTNFFPNKYVILVIWRENRINVQPVQARI